MNTTERERRIIARGEFSDHCHVITGDIEFNSQGQIIVGENSIAVLKHLIETDWMNGKETWTGEHKDITLSPGVYKYIPQQIFDPLTKRIEATKD